jgi:hypothetical protein
VVSGLHPLATAAAPVAWTSEALRFRDSRSFALLSVRSFVTGESGDYYDLC